MKRDVSLPIQTVYQKRWILSAYNKAEQAHCSWKPVRLLDIPLCWISVVVPPSEPGAGYIYTRRTSGGRRRLTWGGGKRGPRRPGVSGSQSVPWPAGAAVRLRGASHPRRWPAARHERVRILISLLRRIILSFCCCCCFCFCFFRLTESWKADGTWKGSGHVVCTWMLS